ncbi:GNAT family N-acetyltransferase [Govanella unica]|uniref:GNAT family N-acetyltransferase n=1 Tax=Govanella unica TaxID=2975056 RepID=A0A9X3TXU2_9PROT|nr:GNAT family N-acetyltransferase [Govania unica]MDA5193738.1 GNAT family N-acetyltransferase [Govania unica]
MTVSDDLQVRAAAVRDLPDILAIYNYVIATSTAVYTCEPVDLANRRAWFEERGRSGYPVLVAEAGGEILGFASFGDFRAWWGYRFTVEHMVHVQDGCRGRGVGRALVEGLFAPALALGKHAMIGGIDADNAASIHFHERLGFSKVGHLPEVGHKFGRWLDLVFMQRILDTPGAPRA